MKLSEILNPGLISVDLQSTEKPELFEEMVQLFVDENLISDADKAVDVLLERERQMSTGVSLNLALPHGKLEEVHDVIMALGISRKGIDYDSLDGEPVYVVIAILSEAGNPEAHIGALVEISRLFSIHGFLNRIRAAETPEQVLDIIRSEE